MSYLFVHKSSFSGWADSFPAQYEDLDFVFDVPFRCALGTPQEEDLSSRLIKLVASFAKEGCAKAASGPPSSWGLDNDTVAIALDGFSLVTSTRTELCHRIRPHVPY
ncbi:hypothetical protein MTO96_009372 [Rhipicephalus appendiculatus]